MVRAATDTFGGLHVLYNNAGVFPADDGGVLDTPESTWERVMEINLKGVWLGCRAAIPAMLDSGGGRIVNVASFVALMGAAPRRSRTREQGRRPFDDARASQSEYARAGIRANASVSRARSRRRCCRAPLGSRSRAPPDGAHSDGPARSRRGAREGGAVPRLDDASFMTGPHWLWTEASPAAYVTPE
jgi:NAD(P)-dependent dehydrogenase (short-subunit alcohol dehydrogenase family)